jgi:hypothetical protein
MRRALAVASTRLPRDLTGSREVARRRLGGDVLFWTAILFGWLIFVTLAD